MNYFDILGDNSIDAVVIATPINSHYQIAKDALNAGKHVFVEKPITIDSGQAEILVHLAKDKILFVGHIFLYHPCYEQLKAAISNEVPVSVDATWNKYGTFHEDIFSNLISHDVSIIAGLFGFDFRNINIHRIVGFVSNVDIIKLSMDLQNELKCNISNNRIYPVKHKIFTVNTEKALLHWIGNKLYRLDKGDKNFRLVFENERDVLHIECQYFIECIKTQKMPISDGEFGLKVVESVELIKSVL